MSPLLEKIRIYLLLIIAFFAFPTFALRARLRSKKDGLRILIFPQLTRIGDLVCMTPVFRSIKEKYPESSLSVLVTPKTAGIIKNNPCIDHIILLEDREYLDFFGLLRFFRKISDRRFTHSFNLATSTLGTLTVLFGLIPNRVKISRKNRPFAELLSDWMNTERVLYKSGDYLPELYLDALKCLGVKGIAKKEVFTDRGSDELVQKKFSELNLEGNIVGISVTAGNKVKEWPTERFGDLANRLLKESGVSVVFIGAPSDVEKMKEAAKYTDSRAKVISDVPLIALPSLIKKLSLFISADTGATHIAEALEIPLIDIVGPVDPREQAPRGDTSIVLTPPKSIPPTIFALRPPGDPELSKKATEAISVEEVFDVAKRLL